MPQHAWTWTIDQQIPSQHGAGRELQDEVAQRLEAQCWCEQDVFAVRLALEEAVANAINHGNRHHAEKQVRIVFKLADDRLRIEISDEGDGFCPDKVPDCTEECNLDVPSGRGITLMKAFMCHVEYNQAGNIVVMEKLRGRSDQRSS